MAEEGSPTPRRALGPLPDEPGDIPTGGRFARAFSPDEPSPLTSTGRLRRLAASPASPGDPFDVPATTPVPPPAPVLPDPEGALPPAAGRRYSASAEPSEFVPAAPRRSAVSATSPASAIEPVLPPPPRPTAPPAVTVPTNAPSFVPPTTAADTSAAVPPGGPTAFPRSVPTAPSVSAPATPASSTAAATLAEPVPDVEEPEPDAASEPAKPAKRRSSRPAVIIIASVLAVVVLVAAGVWLLTLRSGAPSGSPSNSGTASALDPLLTAEDLGTLGGVTWAGSTGTADAGRPLCLPAAAAGLPEAQRTISRRIGATGSQTDSVVQVVDTYADDTAATQAYAARLAQVGTCKDDTAWITGANSISGLADSADSVRLVVQDTTDLYHTLLLSRTGRSVSLVDITTGQAAVTALDLAKVVATALSRQCGGDLGTCPSNPSPATTPPPAGDPKGWLVEADLPRVTPGSGRWGATDPFTTLSSLGSQCEAVNLVSIPGTQSAGQRTLLLADDASAPKGFGVDMVTYTFADATAATTLADKLTKNISKCPDRAPTATVKDGPAPRGTGEAGARIDGSTFLVTQKTATTTVVYRVAVLTVGSKVVYLLGNPTTSFDFTDAQWKAIAIRAGQRATQA